MFTKLHLRHIISRCGLFLKWQVSKFSQITSKNLKKVSKKFSLDINSRCKKFTVDGGKRHR